MLIPDKLTLANIEFVNNVQLNSAYSEIANIRDDFP